MKDCLLLSANYKHIIQGSSTNKSSDVLMDTGVVFISVKSAIPTPFKVLDRSNRTVAKVILAKQLGETSSLIG